MPPKRARIDKPAATAASAATKLVENPETTDEWAVYFANINSKGDFDQVCAVYETLVAQYPLSGQLWAGYVEYCSAQGNSDLVEKILARCLNRVPSSRLFEVYLQYVVNTNQGSDPKSQTTIQQAFEFAISKVYYDRQSGPIFQQYVQFLEKRPATTTWEQQHKMDEMRRIYRKAVTTPIINIEALWRAYNAFENSISRATARKFIDERSGAYMQARSCFRELETLSINLNCPGIPPKRTFDAAEKQQLNGWRRLIEFELSNPLTLDQDSFKERILFVYKYVLSICCYFPELWFDAVQWCTNNSLDTEALSLANQAIEINPMSFALTVGLATLHEENDRSEEAFKTYRRLIEALTTNAPELNERLTLAYVELMQSTKRVFGVKQARKISAECRKIASCTYQIYTASAAIEYQNKDPVAASKIYEIAYRKFRTVPRFILCYLEFLFATQDMTNARVVFEKALSDIGPRDCRPIYDQFLKYEATYADLTALRQLEERYRQIYAIDLIDLVANRYTQYHSDPVAEELHLEKSALNGQDRVLPLPEAIESMLSQLPSTGYDGPIIDAQQLISLVQQVC